MRRVTLKTSTIFVAKGDRTRVFYSVGELPRGLRRELEQSTNGFNSATILIADRRGRQEIRRALNGLPSVLRSRLVTSLSTASGETPAAPPPPPRRFRLPGLGLASRWVLAGLALPAAGLLAWYLLHLP